METLATHDDDATPFHEDTRTLGEKLEADERNWMPHKNSGDPQILYGLVLESGTGTSSYDDRAVPTRRILSRANNIEWTVRGFHGYLAGELDRKNPRVGDFVALVYRGTKPGKEGEHDSHDYKLVVERNPAAPVEGPPEPTGDEDEREAAEDGDGIPF